MAKKRTALYVAGLTCLGFICFALDSISVGIPLWGYFENISGGWDADKGYFGPWKICKELSYHREKCGSDVSRFRMSYAVYLSGIFATISCAALGFFCVLSVIQIAMVSSKEQVVMKYSVLVIVKLALALIASFLEIVSATLFALQIDDKSRNGFTITRGISFYIQILVIVLTVGLFIMQLYDVFFTRSGGDPTVPIDTSSESATTYNNPGFREGKSRNGISVTDASGKPYSDMTIGSMASMSTTLTSVSNGSTVESLTRYPLRSSLKKPRPKESLGIQNPGFSGTGSSPPLNRNGSMKKVRIQTHSTEV